MDPILSVRTWAMTLGALREMRYRARQAGHGMAPLAAAGQRGASARGSVALIPIYGGLTQHESFWTEFFGGASMSKIGAQLQAAIADPGVASIVLDVSSPGGEVYGTAELAAAVRGAAAVKPVVAVANSLAASAAYWAISGATEIMVTPSGEIGSVGVYGVHEDWSQAFDQEGIKVTLISEGEGKTDGNPYGPLSDSAKADMEASVARYYGMFVADVAKGRKTAGVTQGTIKSKWGARVYGAAEAVEIGMADRVGTVQDAIERAAKMRPRSTNTAEMVEALKVIG